MLDGRSMARFLECSLHGENREIRWPADLMECDEWGMVWLKSPTLNRMERIQAYRPALVLCEASASELLAGTPHIICEKPRLDYIRLLNAFFVTTEEPAIHPTAIIEPGARVGESISIGAWTRIGPQVVLGNGCHIGNGVTIEGPVVLGENCRVKSNTVIGSMGFGFEYDDDGVPQHFPHVGRIVFEENVWIGACSTVERATLGVTRVRKNAKIDDLVQVGHNTEIGECTLIMSNVVLCGGAKVGNHCWVAPNVVVRQSVHVADGATIGMGSVVTKDVPRGDIVAGVPAKSMPPKLDYQGVNMKRNSSSMN